MTTLKQFKAAVLIVLLAVVAPAGQVTRNKTGNESMKETKGILLLAHGGSRQWNEEVNKLAAEVNRVVPVEVAFGMATKRTIQDACNRLESRGVTEIVAVPLFVSSHSSVITATAYLLGARKDAPPELALYAKMDHSHGGDHANHPRDSDFDPMTPVKAQVPIRMTSALDRHAIVAEILRRRSLSISREPQHEVVVIVAHGPVSDAENAEWLADMAALVQQVKKASTFLRIEYLTVRDDAPEPIRSQATTELRLVVERASSEGNQVLIVPLLLSYGGIEAGIRKRLEGLSYTMCQQALLPDSRLARWVLSSAGIATQN